MYSLHLYLFSFRKHSKGKLKERKEVLREEKENIKKKTSKHNHQNKASYYSTTKKSSWLVAQVIASFYFTKSDNFFSMTFYQSSQS